MRLKNRFRRGMIGMICAVSLLALLLTGCSEKTETPEKPYKGYASDGNLASGVVATNEDYQLLWDDGSKCVFLYEIATETVWGSTPYDYYLQEDPSGLAQTRLYSPLIVKYYNAASLQSKTVYAYPECVSEGTVKAEQAKDGVQVTYCFDNQGFSIPVQYRLTKDGLQASLQVNDICENDNLVCEVSLLPFMAACKADKDSYLVIPSGSGALMYADEGQRNERSFSAPVYGQDLTTDTTEQLSHSNAIRMPFFGVKAGENALCCILGEGADSARIDAQAGNTELGYASAYATFLLRGQDYIYAQNMNKQVNVTTTYSTDHVDADSFSVTYCPLFGENAGYNGMAAYYRSQLKDVQKNTAEPELYLRLLGGMSVTKSVMGIPVQKFRTATTFAEAETILRELSQTTGAATLLQMVGYDSDGLDTGELGGGFTLSTALGGKKGYQSLLEACQKLKASLYVDFDTIRYASSGNGASGRGSAAFSANRLPLISSTFSITTYNKNEDSSFRLLRRDALPEALTRLGEKATNIGITGLSLAGLTSESYSDYRSTDTFVKNGCSGEISQLMESLSSAGHGLLAQEANAYAALRAEAVIQAPTASDQSDALDVDVPLYQMVFRGLVPLSGRSVNLAADADTAFLQSLETGSGLCFTLAAGWDPDFTYCEDNSAVAFSQYISWKDTITAMSGQARPLLEAVQGCSITAHTILADGVRQTVFSNGTTVTVNYTAQPVQTPTGTVDARSFVFSEEGGSNP